MKTFLLLAASIVITQCDIEIKGFLSNLQKSQKTKNDKPLELEIRNRLAVSIPRYRSSGKTRKDLKLSYRQQTVTGERMKEIALESIDFQRYLDKSIFRGNSVRGPLKTIPQSDSIIAERQAEHIFKDEEESARVKRQVLKYFTIPNSTWKHGIFYTFNTTDHLIQKAFKMGVKIWTDATCIDFVEDKSAKDKVVVVRKSGSSSAVGQLGGDQLLSLGQGGVTEMKAVHEIGHVLGLFHTMSRYDRDNYVTIVKENVDMRHINDFAKEDSSYADVYGLTYDYGSVMHYGELSGSINNQPTMIARDPLYQKTMGSEIISFSDIFMINEHHGCNAKCKKSTSAKCTNEGFPHPRNCSICICPGGYGGALCDRRPSGCGEDLVATSEKQVVDYRLGQGFRLRDEFDFCNYLITAPAEKKIEVDVRLISSGYDSPGCPNGGIEVKAQKDQKLTGYRFCSVKGTKGPVVSTSNRLPVILFNRLDTMHVTFTYRYVD